MVTGFKGIEPVFLRMCSVQCTLLEGRYKISFFIHKNVCSKRKTNSNKFIQAFALLWQKKRNIYNLTIDSLSYNYVKCSKNNTMVLFRNIIGMLYKKIVFFKTDRINNHFYCTNIKDFIIDRNVKAEWLQVYKFLVWFYLKKILVE